MAGFDARATVQYRNRFGRFDRLIGQGTEGMARDMVETTAQFAHEGAPVGPSREDYGRRELLSGSIEGRMTSATAGVVHARAGHAGPQELGAGPHIIPNAFGRGLPVLHPGNAPQPYIRPALQKLRPLIPGMLRKWFPF